MDPIAEKAGGPDLSQCPPESGIKDGDRFSKGSQILKKEPECRALIRGHSLIIGMDPMHEDIYPIPLESIDSREKLKEWLGQLDAKSWFTFDHRQDVIAIVCRRFGFSLSDLPISNGRSAMISSEQATRFFEGVFAAIENECSKVSNGKSSQEVRR